MRKEKSKTELLFIWIVKTVLVLMLTMNPVLIFSESIISSGLYIEDNFQDLGIIPRGETVYCQFQLENRGSTQLTIHLISSCSCTYLFDGKLILKPGEQKEVSFSYTGYTPGVETQQISLYIEEQDKTFQLTIQREIAEKKEL
jgi:hypothetical protein